MLSRGVIEKLKIQPYEPCPCGSGQKFKFCCYKKARDAVKHKKITEVCYTDGQLNHLFHQSWQDADFKICLGFDNENCTPLIKSAHTIQNNRILNRISENGHLYQIKSKITKNGIVPEFRKISRNKASTFFGFCEYHDTEIFRPIEQKEYSKDLEQNFLFAFRALAFEYHTKQRLLHHIQNHFKKFPEAMFNINSINLYRTTLLDIKDYRETYETFKNDYLSKTYNNLRTIYRKLNYEVEFATSDTFAVQFDLNGKMINDIYHDKSDKKMPSIYINVYPIEGGTNIILSYHLDDESVYNEFFDQIELLTNEELIRYLNYLIIEYTENIFFSPRLIENMNEEKKKSLLRTSISSINLLEKFSLAMEGKYYQFNIFQKNI